MSADYRQRGRRWQRPLPVLNAECFDASKRLA